MQSFGSINFMPFGYYVVYRICIILDSVIEFSAENYRWVDDASSVWDAISQCFNHEWGLVSLETEEEELFVVGLFDEGTIANDLQHYQFHGLSTEIIHNYFINDTYYIIDCKFTADIKLCVHLYMSV